MELCYNVCRVFVASIFPYTLCGFVVPRSLFFYLFFKRYDDCLACLQCFAVQFVMFGYIVHKLTAITVLVLLVHVTPGNLPQRLSFAYGVGNQRLLITREQKTMCSSSQLCGAVTGQKDKTSKQNNSEGAWIEIYLHTLPPGQQVQYPYRRQTLRG